ncbi:MAG: endonuclease III [Nitrospinaceae bacterium]|nr:MAG: endonuclease III [Nitrospinaceae bacterium]
MNAATINRIYKKLSQSLPNARSELDFKNNFELLISVILSAQATDKSVNAVTGKLFSLYPTPEKILQCGEARLKTLIKTIGLAPTKARNIIRACQILLDEYGGTVPGNRESLEKLPGVGRKTANVVLNEGFGQPTIAVDTHVFRVSQRTGLAPGKTVLETEDRLLKITPEKWKKQAHHYLILHGRYVCKAKNFNCGQCVIVKECQYPDKIF